MIGSSRASASWLRHWRCKCLTDSLGDEVEPMETTKSPRLDKATRSPIFTASCPFRYSLRVFCTGPAVSGESFLHLHMPTHCNDGNNDDDDDDKCHGNDGTTETIASVVRQQWSFEEDSIDMSGPLYSPGGSTLNIRWGRSHSHSCILKM